MTDLVREKIDYPIGFGIERGTTPDDIMEFGRKLNEGELHLGVVWGLEFGWLKRRFPELEPLVRVDNGVRFGYRSQIMVRRQDPMPDLRELKGKTLALSKRATLIDKIFLHETLSNRGYAPDTFFQRAPYPSSGKVIISLLSNDADKPSQCVLVSNITYLGLSSNVAKQLAAVDSDGFPMPAFIGRKTHVEALKPGLWNDLQKELTGIHGTSEGRQLARFWTVRQFVKPKDEYMKSVRKSAARYPITKLPNVK